MVNETDPPTCRHCGTNLQGKPIPQESIDKGYYGDPATAPRFYSRVIGVEIRGVYDGVLFYRCPDCGGTWHRWKDSKMRAKAQVYMDKYGSGDS